MKRKLWLWMLVVVLGAIAVYQHVEKKEQSVKASAGATLPTEVAPMLNKVAPSFELLGLDGKSYHVGGARDKVLLLNFWASWCEPCQEEAPTLKQLAEQYKDQLDMYAVNVTSSDSEEKAQAFVKKYQLTNPILMDTKGDQFNLYKGVAFPTNILIDRHGVIRDITLGVLPPEQLEQKIKQIIAM